MGRSVNYNSDRFSVLVTEHGFQFYSMRWHSNQYPSVDIDNNSFSQIVEFLINFLSNKKCCKCSSNIYVLGDIEVCMYDSGILVQRHSYSHNNYFPVTDIDLNSNIIYLKERFRLC